MAAPERVMGPKQVITTCNIGNHVVADIAGESRHIFFRPILVIRVSHQMTKSSVGDARRHAVLMSRGFIDSWVD